MNERDAIWMAKRPNVLDKLDAEKEKLAGQVRICIKVISPIVHRLSLHESNTEKISPLRSNHLSLPQLVKAIEREFQFNNQKKLDEKRKAFIDLLEHYSGDLRELLPFSFVDPTKTYTRNLIATDSKSYALILIIWNRNRYSPIHDHPCDGCWVKIISGAMNEVQYRIQQNKLYEVSNIILDRGVTYIDDSMGLHKVGNPRHDQLAVTLHLYSPPFDACRVWMDSENSNQSSLAHSYYFSVFGNPID
uniref:Cysteine dioxygenase n=1 Tax=Albugo laibachii Nc14 TaxID=890382 RepID=F0W915_9STRA|nr:cysteine dioxygenase putative [Albugo laibachii Nc14]|eukprot:CCA17626.1 cysteine dioxygenase putative [Albugo laibachii Nc14]